MVSLYQSGRKTPPLDPVSDANLEDTARLFKEAARKTGRNPAVMILFSHPKTNEKESYLLGDIISHAVDLCGDLSQFLGFAQATNAFSEGLAELGHLAEELEIHIETRQAPVKERQQLVDFRDALLEKVKPCEDGRRVSGFDILEDQVAFVELEIDKIYGF